MINGSPVVMFGWTNNRYLIGTTLSGKRREEFPTIGLPSPLSYSRNLEFWDVITTTTMAPVTTAPVTKKIMSFITAAFRGHPKLVDKLFVINCVNFW